MRLENQDGQIVLKEVYNSITLETREGKQLHICMRDFGFEMKIDDGEWHLLTDESDFLIKPISKIKSNDIVLPELPTPTQNNMIPQTEISKAVDVLIAALNEDKSEGSYYYSWQANIAMAFKDEFDRHTEVKINMHDVANQAAKNFLDMLCHKNNDMDDVIKVAERLYREANPDTKKDTPSYAYEQVEKANLRRINAKSERSLYDWCMMELSKSDKQGTPTTNE